MDKTYQKFLRAGIDLSSVGVERRTYNEPYDNFQFVWVTDRLRFGGCLRWFVGRGQYGEGLKSVKKNAALLHFLAFGAFDLLTFFGHKKGRPTERIPL